MSAATQRTARLVIAYDGSAFHGFAPNPDVSTVDGALTKALETITQTTGEMLKIEDLKPGMKMEGIVRNIVDFGAFIDIGLKNDGLAHISKLKSGFVKHPMDVVSVGQQVTC